MNWFRRSSDKKSSAFTWDVLDSRKQFLRLLQENPRFAVFKHSTRCSISSMAKHRLERGLADREHIPVYYLDLIAHRDVSDLIAETLGVAHQSPQLIIILDGKAVFDASHNGVTADVLTGPSTAEV